MAFRQLFSRIPTGSVDDTPFSQWFKEAWLRIAQVEEWIEIGGSGGEPAFQHSWVNFGLGTETAAFYKDPHGRVHLKGLINTGTVGLNAFVLPSGYRPMLNLRFGTISNATIGRVDILFTGNVIPVNPSNNAWVSLDGISFRAEQ